jgi:hypothetical protein
LGFSLDGDQKWALFSTENERRIPRKVSQPHWGATGRIAQAVDFYQYANWHDFGVSSLHTVRRSTGRTPGDNRVPTDRPIHRAVDSSQKIGHGFRLGRSACQYPVFQNSTRFCINPIADEQSDSLTQLFLSALR